MKQVVIDASIILKWYLIDEEDSQKAIGLLQLYISNELEILAPSLLEYEIVNGLIIAQRRGRIKEEKLHTAIEGFLNLEIKLRTLSFISQSILHYCKVYNCSAYDASYLAVAENNGAPLITADARLYNMVKKDLKWIKWLGDIL